MAIPLQFDTQKKNQKKKKKKSRELAIQICSSASKPFDSLIKKKNEKTHKLTPEVLFSKQFYIIGIGGGKDDNGDG